MPNDCSNCQLAERVKRLEGDFELEAQKNSQRHEEFFRRIRVLEQHQAVNGTCLDTIVEKLDAIAGDVASLKERPSRLWDLIVTGVITGTVGFLVAQLL